MGEATSSTDNGPVLINASATALRDDYLTYLTCGSDSLALVMVSSAVYPNLTGPLPAVMSPLTYQGELRTVVPSRGVLTVSDDLQAPALSGQTSPARRAIAAGLDLAMYARTEAASASAYRTLLADLRRGDISAERIRGADQAIQALKGRLDFR